MTRNGAFSTTSPFGLMYLAIVNEACSCSKWIMWFQLSHNVCAAILHPNSQPLGQAPRWRTNVRRRGNHPILRVSTPKNACNLVRDIFWHQSGHDKIRRSLDAREHFRVHGRWVNAGDSDRWRLVGVFEFCLQSFVNGNRSALARSVVNNAGRCEISGLRREYQKMAVILLSHAGKKRFCRPQQSQSVNAKGPFACTLASGA